LNADQSSAEVLLQQLKWPIEALKIGMRVKDYNSSDVSLRRQHLDKWHTFSKITPTSITTQGWKAGKTTLKSTAYANPVPAALTFTNGSSATSNLGLAPSAWSADNLNRFIGINAGDILTFVLDSTTCSTPPTVPGTYSFEVAQNVYDGGATGGVAAGRLSFKELVGSVNATTAFGATPVVLISGATYRVDTPSAKDLSTTVSVPTATIDTITIKAHGIPIYNGFISKFYNAYLPYHYGGPNVAVPEDSGILYIPFGLYPGTYQPSGHINVSRKFQALRKGKKNLPLVFSISFGDQAPIELKRQDLQTAGKPLEL
jgi:hypothetical protein